MGKQIWRKVDGKAILCTDCRKNETQVLYANGLPVGVQYVCTAEDDICVRLKKPIEDKEAHENFKDFFHKKESEES